MAVDLADKPLEKSFILLKNHSCTPNKNKTWLKVTAHHLPTDSFYLKSNQNWAKEKKNTGNRLDRFFKEICYDLDLWPRNLISRFKIFLTYGQSFGKVCTKLCNRERNWNSKISAITIIFDKKLSSRPLNTLPVTDKLSVRSMSETVPRRENICFIQEPRRVKVIT